MSSKVEGRITPALRRKEVIVGFEAASVAAPFILRCGAVLIDYILVLTIPVAALLLGRYVGNDGAKLVSGTLNDTGWLVAALVGASNLVVLPMFTGRSVGKMMTGLRIVRIDGSAPSPTRIALRQSLGWLITAFTLGTGFFVSALNRSGRSLHDYLFGTVVIHAERRYK